MTPEPPRTLRLSIDTAALAANWRALDTLSGSASAGAAVKANAYGVGVDQAVPALRNAGCRNFYVAHWSEVADVVRHVPPEQVSVLHGPLTADDVAFARATGVRPVINSLVQARLWIESGGGACDLMVDTGINRLGISPSEVGDPVIAALQVDTVMSHLARSDEDHPFNAEQLRRASEAFASVPAKRRSLANSAGVALGSDYCFDVTRPGLSLFGGIQRPELEGKIAQVVRPQAVVIQVRTLSRGDGVGYNSAFVADRTMRVGTVSLGYADGILRCWGGGLAVQHEGRMLHLLGKISMDMIVVDLSDAPDMKEGDWLELPYNLPDASKASGLSQYELLTLLGVRFER